MDYLVAHKAFHAEKIEPYLGMAEGCTPEQVDELEKFIGFELPLAYKQYLLWMGEDEYGIFKGEDFHYGNVLFNTYYLPHWCTEMRDLGEMNISLPSNYLSFFNHQGYQYAWFELPKSDDNPVTWCYGEGMNDDNKREAQLGIRFTDFLMGFLIDNSTNLPKRTAFHRAFRESAETGKTISVDKNLTVSSAGGLRPRGRKLQIPEGWDKR